MSLSEYFDRFFEEKELPYRMFEIEHGDTMHFIDTDVVIESIKTAPATEQAQIRDMLVKLDFHNAPIVSFLEHLAGAMVKVAYP